MMKPRLLPDVTPADLNLACPPAGAAAASILSSLSSRSSMLPRSLSTPSESLMPGAEQSCCVTSCAEEGGVAAANSSASTRRGQHFTFSFHFISPLRERPVQRLDEALRSLFR